MNYRVAFLCLLANLVNGRKPFEVFDVTTLVRLNETEAGTAPPSWNTERTWIPDFPNSVYEVHSRTDAIGLQTNFEEVTGIRDNLQDSELTCTDATNSSLCKDWVFDGFEVGTWSIHDPIIDWRPIQHDYHDKRIMKNNNTLETSERHIYGYTMNSTYLYPKGKRTQCYDEIKVLFRLHKSLFFACPCRGTHDVYQGVEVLPSGNQNSSRELRGQITEYNRNPLLKKATIGREEISVPDFVETAYLTRNSVLFPDSLLLVFNVNGNVSAARPFVLSKFSNSFRIIPYSLDSPDFQVYKTIRPMSQRSIGRKGVVTSPVITNPRNKLCLLMRFFLNGSIKWTFSVFSPNDGVEEPSISVDFIGTGEIYSKKFIIPLKGKLPNFSPIRLRFSFETNSSRSFIIRSFRKCSGDADVLFALPSQLKERSKGHVVKSLSTAKQDFTKLGTSNVGFRIKNHQKAFSSKNPMKKCYNGGINVEEWCQCLPGYKGPTCEEACAPYQFGADCGGVCNPIGSSDCKGILLAGPGLPLECGRGYTGKKCDTECKLGHYGPNCKLQCGQCANGICDRFSGKCNGPCRPGYTKDTCQDRLASLDEPPMLANIGEDYVEGYVRFEEPVDLYPILKILYKNDKASTWNSKFFPMNQGRNFTINKLHRGEKYLLRAIPVHKDGDYYENPYEKVIQFFTKCNVPDSRFDIKVTLSNKTLIVEWELKSTHHSCMKTGYNLEISSPELLEPYVLTVGPNETKKSIEPVFLKEGSVRLRTSTETMQSKWSDPVPFQQRIDAGGADALKIKFVTSTRIDFQWMSSKDIAEDILNCESSRILCEQNHNSSLKQRVKPGAFSIDGLAPFTRYTCILEATKLAATTATKPDVPFVEPKNRLELPVSSITDSKATLQWEDATNCTDLNGIFEGFVVELWDGNELKVTSKKGIANHFLIQFSNLTADTSYMARVFLVNTEGWNREKYAPVPFQTKSKAPDAVTNLLAYKRTRSTLWLRWMPPKSDPNIIKYRIVLSASGVETKSEEIPPKRCDIWPDFVCYKVGGLVPDVVYNVTVEAQNGAVNHYSPPSLTHALTKETEAEAPSLHVVDYTPHSIILGWQLPVVLNSDPKFFVVTLDQVGAYSNDEQTTVATQMTVYLSENVESYQLQINELNSAASYVMTVSAGNRGARAAVNVDTPPEQPPQPRAPTVTDVQIIARGIERNGNSSSLLSGYLVLVSTNSIKDMVFDKILAENLRKQLGDFTVVEEFPSDLDQETVVLSESRSRRGKFSLVEKKSFEPGLNYRVAVAAISSYRGSHSATISSIITYQS